MKDVMKSVFPTDLVDLILGNDLANQDLLRPLLRELAAAPAFRSAQVEELILDHDYFRRPLRPEDLAFVDVSSALDRTSVSSLSALATHRLLLCIYDLQLIRPPLDANGWNTFLEFYSDRNCLLGSMVCPFLENRAFSQLEQNTVPLAADCGGLVGQVMEVQAKRVETEAAISARTSSQPFRTDMLRMRLVQFFGPADTRRRALALVNDAVGSAQEWLTHLPIPIESLVVEQLGYPISLHACWQFYLPSTMAVANLLHYLTRRARNIFRALGALVFTSLFEDTFQSFHSDLFSTPPAAALTLDRLQGMLQRLIGPAAERWGERVWSEVSLGLQLCVTAQSLADEDLMRQLSWLSGIDNCKRLAESIQGKIDREQIAIDRDTFTEPREMCSTTHVHDDHRLVVIESGEMVFWGAPGMQVCLSPGEMILVPRQRLHGSSVLSDVCVYHQPIIPEDWLGSYLSNSQMVDSA